MKKACLTVWWNDKVILDVWIRYYRKEFDLYVIVDQPKHLDEIERREKEGVTFIRGEAMLSTEHAKNKTREVQDELLKKYDWVLFTNCDEIIAPEPKYKDFDDLITKLDQDFISCEGFEVLECNEPPIDFTKPLLKQRKYWMKHFNMNKTLLSRVPLVWREGHHSIVGTEAEETKLINDTGLYLIHLRHFNLKGDKIAEDTKTRDFGPFLHPPHNYVLTHKDEYKTPMPEWVRKLI